MFQLTCQSCSRGMLPDYQRNILRCYACLLEVNSHQQWRDFDPTGEAVLFSEDHLLHALKTECKAASQKEVAKRVNITEQYLSDLIRGRRPFTPVIARYYWMDRKTVYIPRFTHDQAKVEVGG